MVYGIFEGVSGRRVGVVQALSRGVKALFPALGIVIITAIVWWLHGALLAAIFGGFGNFTVVEPWLPVFVAMMVVFAILAFFFWEILPVAVLERRFLSSFGRCLFLTKGSRWRILGLAILLFLFAKLVHWLATLVTIQLFMMFDSFTPIIIFSWVVSIFLTAYSAVVITVSYHRLRAVRDGPDERDIAAVFD